MTVLRNTFSGGSFRMKDRLWTKQYLLVIVTNFLLYVVYY